MIVSTRRSVRGVSFHIRTNLLPTAKAKAERKAWASYYLTLVTPWWTVSFIHIMKNVSPDPTRRFHR